MACKEPEIEVRLDGLPEGTGRNYTPVNLVLPPIKDLELKFLPNVSKEYKSGIQYKPLKSKNIKLPNTTLAVSDRSVAVGKRLIVINNSNFGPQFKQREIGTQIIINGTQITDPFRMVTGRYWTLDDQGKSLIYLKNNPKVSGPYKTMDFNFTGKGIIKINDLELEGEYKTERTKEKIDSLSKVDSSDNKEYTFGTQQWVLLQADENSFLSEKENRAPKHQNEKGIEINLDEVQRNNFTPIITASPKFNSSEGLNLKISYFDKRKWKEFIESERGIQQGTDFFDYTFDMPQPFTDKELTQYTTINNPLRAQIIPTYNFLIKNYEKNLNNVSEQMIPNLYIIQSELNEISSDKDNRDIITLDGLINLKEANLIIDNQNTNVKTFGGQYFERFTKQYRNLYSDSSNEGEQREKERRRQKLEKLTDKLKIIGMTENNVKLLKSLEDKKHLFPMYMDIEFSMDKTTQIEKILKDSNLSSGLIKRVMNNIQNREGYQLEKVLEISETLSQVRNNLEIGTLKKVQNFNKTDRKVWDISDWLEEFDNLNEQIGEQGQIIEGPGDIGLFLGAKTDDLMISNEPTYRFFRNLMKLVFAGKMRTLIKERFRTFEEMMSGKPAYSETMLYRIEKSLASTSGNPLGEPVQNFYFPNSSEIEVLNFIDTQVKYNKKYVYNVYAYQMVIGTKYSYSNRIVKDNFASFLVTQKPSLKMVEVLYHKFVGSIIDSPPIQPNIELIPYKGINNRILINMDANVGDYMLDPIIIEQTDIEKIDSLRKALNLNSFEKIRYKTDDHSGMFQIFRTDTRPTKYSDFRGKLLASVETDVSKSTEQEATSASFVDRIKANKKYWYIFRVVDIHGHISNPTSVFELEMIDDNGTIYPIIDVVDFEPEIKKQPDISMRKYLYLAPKLGHTIINEEKSGIVNAISVKDKKNIHLGIEDESIWGKEYKIRLTSKKTGRKIDFNIKVNNQMLREVKKEDN